MKTCLGILSLSGIMMLSVACNRVGDMQRENAPDDQEIQREEVLHADDIRETDNYNRSVPVESTDEEIDRDVLEKDEVEINK